MLRGTSSWPESGSYWPVWVAGGDFLFWSSTHWCLWGRDLIYHDRDPRCAIYFSKRMLLSVFWSRCAAGLWPQRWGGKKVCSRFTGTPNTFNCSPGIRCFVNPLKALLTALSNSQVVVGRCGSGGNLDCPGSTSHGNLCCEVDVLPDFWSWPCEFSWRSIYLRWPNTRLVLVFLIVY